jgi:hypothetical protein
MTNEKWTDMEGKTKVNEVKVNIKRRTLILLIIQFCWFQV